MPQIKIPFTVTANGEIATISDQREVDRQNLITLIGTNPGERAMRPEYGVATRDLLFDSDDTMLAQVLISDIEDAVRTYQPDIEVTAVNANDEGGDGLVQIDVEYQPAPGRLNTGSDSISTSVLGGG